MKNAYLIEFKSHGSQEDGFLTAIEHNTGLPFDVKRVYTITETKENNIRGFHAHRHLQQLIFAVHGQVDIYCEDITGETFTLTLDSPKYGLYCGPMVWHTLTYHHDAILMVLASDKYEELDYIRSYNEFLERRANL